MPSTDSTAGSSRAYALLSASWFFALGALGVFFPYFSLFLRENAGLSSTHVGIVLAISPLLGIVAQPAWGQLADRTGARVGVLVVVCLGTGLGYAALARAVGLWPVVAATLTLALFQSALFANLASVTFGALADPAHFGRVRVYGTVGFAIVLVATPPGLHALRAARGLTVEAGGPSEPGLEWMFDAAFWLMVAAALAAFGLRGTSRRAQRARRGDLRLLLSNPAFVRVLAFIAGAHLFLHGPMQMFPLYVRARGGSMTDVSHMWICMLLVEVPLILHSGRLFARFGVTRLMAAAVAAGGLRWLLSALAPSLAYAYPVQAIHGLVVAGLNVGAALHVEQIVPTRLRSTAQGFAVMVGTSIGGALSSVLCGAAVDRAGVDAAYVAFGIGAAAWAIAFFRPLSRG